MYLTSGFAEVIFRWLPAVGYREAMSTQAFAIAGWNSNDIDQVYDEWQTFFASIGLPATQIASGVTVKVGTVNPAAPIVFTFDDSLGGSGSGAISPPSVAMLANKATLLGGRHGRGRLFLPAPPENQVDNVGALDSTFRGNVQTSLDDLMTNIGTQLGGEPYLLHAESSPAPTLIQSITLQGLVATQRRRLSRH